ncbi:heat shock factor-binding protein 1 isoform X2 [Folsomia candida]|uniref:heat shock factor-binding protein 1 isoform X2 n=1 Tax=Folsomia candida TaxID=158441 RepID=UPI000B909348|nr:heat shock factor-binding protein 1 isoform X2 [Folsomia candida]
MADVGVTDLEKNEPKNIQELTQYSLLQNMQDKFQQISDQILNRIDDMGGRVDELEKNIADLMTQAGAAPTPGFDQPPGPGGPN